MATSYRLALVSNVGQLNDAIAAAIDNGEMPLGRPDFLDHYYTLVVGEGAAVTFESYEVVIANDARTLNSQVQRMLAANSALTAYGAPYALRGGVAQIVASGISGSDDSPSEVISNDITDATTVGRQVLTAADADAARDAIGAGTSNLALGTGAGDAMPGNTTIPAAVTWATIGGKPAVVAEGADMAAARTSIGAAAAADIPDVPDAPTWATIAGKPAVVAEGADMAAARTSIGAGTSNLALGTTASTAKAGDWTPDPGAAVADAADETETVAQLNALLASLRAAGVISS